METCTYCQGEIQDGAPGITLHWGSHQCGESLKAQRDKLLLQIGEALKACPWATHAENHHEPKHCIAALLSQCEMLGDERRGLVERLHESNRLKDEAEKVAFRLHQLIEKHPCWCKHTPVFVQCQRCRGIEIFNEWEREPSEKRNDEAAPRSWSVGVDNDEKQRPQA